MDTLPQHPREPLSKEWEHVVVACAQASEESILMETSKSPPAVDGLRKDKALVALADRGNNVAQFVSFVPTREGTLHVAYSRIAGFAADYPFPDVANALMCLLQRSPARSINLRSYTPDSPRSRTFLYGLTDVKAALAAAEDLAREGLYVIANETIDIHDGGVSGVVLGDMIEFAPDDTPRCVEKPSVASLPLAWGRSLLQTVYGFEPALDAGSGRLEFSIHPERRGWRQDHTLVWEYEDADASAAKPTLHWPNRFSRLIGDKAFGLLVAHQAGLAVPWTTVIGRRVSPFSFGTRTGETEVWIRTCPTEPEPGRYSTFKGWRDPFRLLADEDPDGDRIMSVLRQDAVPAQYSGAAIVGGDGALVIEGLAGEGDRLMLGERLPELLPQAVRDAVTAAFEIAVHSLGPVRFEWVFDGTRLWIVQLHVGATVSLSDAIVPGEAQDWVELDAQTPLAELRRTLATLAPNTGLRLVGVVNATSHIADLLRKAGVPTQIVKAPAG
ncbi:hypothetical protein [Methylobacterium gregans]|uniref:Uncharacterized protein n=1 Tax=Methylobacterium gregans TaxID=374424 RepID=A0AA37MAY4_9HYPH|nr:hypothetical protein [Methylobacterium gregans]MDQ0518853.1 hypothetical protein [Methylobacterium gregans]GJD79052.1 hypothetical protein NBEOAGPD_2272 [Methylobacterium gregans]GLS57256.1 hypothetical protein GCM10007886_54420 [Methylobacterium gregans]